jgi:hypothetical protein
MDWIQAIGPTVLVIIGGLITWAIQSRVEELRSLEAKLREDRLRIYGELLDPFVLVFSNLGAKSADQASKKIMSFEYKRNAFNLALIGSDDVVRAFSDFMQYNYKRTEAEPATPKDMLRYFGRILLAIRRSLGNQKTQLDEIDMIKWFIRDLDAI